MTAPLPSGSCDSHCHVIGPHESFPLFGGAENIRSDSCAVHENLLATLGLERALIVHPSSVYGDDHSAMLEALRANPTRYRGVAVARSDIIDAQLDRWSEAGVCALRFVPKKTAQGTPFPGSADFKDLFTLAPRLRERGMHAQVWADCADLIANEVQLRKLGLPVVLDHMAQINIAAGPKGTDFLRLCGLLRDGQVFVKLTICRNSKQRPDYDELRPFHDALVNANPDGLVWGSDWPHLRMNDEAPDPSGLLALFLSWISDVHIVRKILVDTPKTLFGFTPAEK